MSSHKIASTQRFSAMKIAKASAEYALLAEETENDFHGPMPITEFLDAFMKTEDDKKPPKRATQIFKNMPRVGQFESVFVSIYSSLFLATDVDDISFTEKCCRGIWNLPEAEICQHD